VFGIAVRMAVKEVAVGGYSMIGRLLSEHGNLNKGRLIFSKQVACPPALPTSASKLPTAMTGHQQPAYSYCQMLLLCL
jgi:hypothetical protein